MTTLPTVKDFCSKSLDDYFSRTNTDQLLSPFKQPEALSTFQQKPEALLKLRDNLRVPVPSSPNSQFPRLLLWNLKEEGHKTSAVYKYLDTFTKTGPTSLYGTSGAGKTRRIFEYLSHNKGLYFLAGTSTRDPGSRDFESTFHLGLSHLGFRKEGEQYDSEKINMNIDNHKTVTLNVQVLVYVRYLIHDKICDLLSRTPTAYEWLLLQLYPETFLGSDIFAKTAKFCLDSGRFPTPTVNLYSVEEHLKETRKDICSAIFVDEAQLLLKNRKEGFFLSTDYKFDRTSFSPVLKAFCESQVFLELYPTFSGTGMSFDEIRVASRSATAKHSLSKTHKPFFMDFEHLKIDKVQEYLDTFFDFKNISDGLKNHLCKWLLGRPRWTANFAEMYMFKGSRNINFSTRGNFNVHEGRFVQALDRYIANMTESNTVGNRRTFWPTEDPTSVYASFRRVMNEANKYPVLRTLEELIFKYAVSGEPTFVTEQQKILIENGVAAVSKTLDCPDDFKGVLSEPLVIQAGINYFGMDMYQRNMDFQTDKGIAFEKLVVPYLQKNLSKITAIQLNTENPFQDYQLPSKSSYGVISKKCNTPKETIEWINSATNATIEGTYPPFCDPDNFMGPDHLGLLWNGDHSQFLSLFSQDKKRKDFSQPQALSTLVPSVLYHDNKLVGCASKKRKDAQVSSTTEQTVGESNTEGSKERKLEEGSSTTKQGAGKRAKKCEMNKSVPEPEWLAAKKKLVQNGAPCLRFMVQYPKQETSAAKGGQKSHQNSIEGCSEEPCTETHDYLVTVDSSNIKDFFNESVDVLERNS